MKIHRTNDRPWIQTLLTLLIGNLLILGFLSLDLIADYTGWHTLSHMMAEILSVMGLLSMLFYLSFLWWNARSQALSWKAHAQHAEAEAQHWKKEAKDLLAGLGQAIDRQLILWDLTTAEKEISLLMLKGLSFKEIAQIREVSERTVRQQATIIYKKSGLASRSEFSAFFLEDLLLPVEP